MSKGCVPTQVTNGKTKGEAGPQQIKDPQRLAAKSISCPGGQLSSFLRMQTHLCYRDAAPADLQPETVFSQSIRGSPSLTSSSERPLLTSPLGTSIFNHSPRPSPALFSTLSVHTGTFFYMFGYLWLDFTQRLSAPGGQTGPRMNEWASGPFNYCNSDLNFFVCTLRELDSNSGFQIKKKKSLKHCK